jgi:hypothetical protein
MSDGTGKGTPIAPPGDDGRNGAATGEDDVRIEADALTALNAALGGVEMLNVAVSIIQDTANQIDRAKIDIGLVRFHGIEDLARFTEAKKTEIDSYVKSKLPDMSLTQTQQDIENPPPAQMGGEREL